MSTQSEPTLDDLARVPDGGKAELVNGELRLMAPTGGLPGYAAGEIVASLREYARQTGSGYALGDNVGFVVDLPNRQSFSPDAAFYTGELKMEFLDGAPVFAAEVRSAGNYGKDAEAELAGKRDDYFAAGTLVVWDVDLKAGVVMSIGRKPRMPRPSTSAARLPKPSPPSPVGEWRWMNSLPRSDIRFVDAYQAAAVTRMRQGRAVARQNCRKDGRILTAGRLAQHSLCACG